MSGGLDAYFAASIQYSTAFSSGFRVESDEETEIQAAGDDIFFSRTRAARLRADVLVYERSLGWMDLTAGLRYVFERSVSIEIAKETLVDSFSTRNDRVTTLHLPEIRGRIECDLSPWPPFRAKLYSEFEYAPLFWCSLDQDLEVRPLGLSDSLSQSFWSPNGISAGLGLILAHALGAVDLGIGVTRLGIRYDFLTDVGKVSRNGGIADVGLSARLSIDALKLGGLHPVVDYTYLIGQEIREKIFVGME